ncbi:MFS transporter [Vitreoscilla sp. C1]|uniref:MFS transporter n=1 Tax=Vitreoscilla sp. (strain C1) TaxID=96942 RepID=UPI00148EE992|nr:MFS transporter [Vitreoscilla sp. C1]QJQ52254.1 MFS transporter [Vitreoscilla sp. C1]
MSTPKLSLNKLTFLFPLALVLFEFSVYIGNDLVQPAMLAITKEFGVSSSLAPSSMSLYLLGGACVAWLLGPLSDRLGRKKVMLAGVAFFSICCLIILLSQNIEQFLFLRLLQGTGLAVISAVGYATIQETFDEKDAIKVMALMANISLLAPLLGPVLGAFLIDYVSWHWGFVGIAVLSFTSFFGLKNKMPNTPPTTTTPLSFKNMYLDFKEVYRNPRFIGLTLALPMLSLPLMLWIALSPVMLVEDWGLSSMQYGWAQFPVLGGLITGNVLLVRLVDRFPLGKTIFIGVPLMLIGAILIVIGTIWQVHFLTLLIIGMTCISLGEGLSFSVLYRFALMSSDVSKGTVAAAVSMLMTLCFFLVIELVRVTYDAYGIWMYSLTCLGLIALWFTFPYALIQKIMREKASQATHH